MFNWLINSFLANAFNNIRVLIDFLAAPFLDPVGFFRGLKRGTLSLPAGVKRALVFLFVFSVVVTLGVLTWALGLDRHASGPWFFRKTWMGWLALLCYFIIKVFIAVLRQINLLPALLKSWPDVHWAMEAGRKAVADAEFRIDQTPVFLVVGLSNSAEKAFVQSDRVGKTICVDDPDLPVHWYGDEEALWVTLPGVSSTAAQAELLSHVDVSGDDESSFDSTSMTTLTGREVVGQSGRRGSDAETLVTASQRATTRSRMAYFCQELRELRGSVCAANGVVLMLPFNSAAAVDLHARSLNECVRTDMAVLQEDLGVQCLTLTVMAGNNDNPAFLAYIRSLSSDSFKRRCGVAFPQLVRLQDEDSSKIYDWLMRDFELQAMHLYRQSPGDPDNESIFEFMDSFREGRKYFSGLLSSTFAQDLSNKFYFGGLYLAELSTVGSESLPFLNGVLAKITKEHDELISWSDRAIVDDRRNRRVSYALFAMTALMLFVSAGMVWNLVGN